MITWRDIIIEDLRYQEMKRLAHEIRLAQLTTAPAKQRRTARAGRLSALIASWVRKLIHWLGQDLQPPSTIHASDPGNGI